MVLIFNIFKKQINYIASNLKYIFYAKKYLRIWRLDSCEGLMEKWQ